MEPQPVGVDVTQNCVGNPSTIIPDGGCSWGRSWAQGKGWRHSTRLDAEIEIREGLARLKYQPRVVDKDRAGSDEVVRRLRAEREELILETIGDVGKQLAKRAGGVTRNKTRTK